MFFWTLFINNEGYINEIILSKGTLKKVQDVWHLYEATCVLLTVGFGATIHMCRVWLLYFDMQLSRSLQNKTWQMAIDPNIESNNWFLDSKNQRNYGRNGKRLLIYGFSIDIFVIAIFFLIQRIIEINFGSWYNFYSYSILVLYYVIKMLVEVQIWRKLNQFKKYDNFGIYYELKTFLKIAIVYCVFVAVLIPVVFMYRPYTLFLSGTPALIFSMLVMYYLIPNTIKYNERKISENYNSGNDNLKHININTNININSKKNGKTIIAKTKIDNALNATRSGIGCSSRSVSRAVSLTIEVVPISTGSTESISDTGPRASTPAMNNNSNTNTSESTVNGRKRQSTSWSKCMSSPYIYEKFMNHLSREFSVENLLFITEYIQIKNVLKQKYYQLEEMMKENRSIRFDIKLPKYHSDENDDDNDDDNDDGTPYFDDNMQFHCTDDEHDKNEKNDKNPHDGDDDAYDDDKLKTVSNINRKRGISTPSLSAEPPIVPVSLIAKQLCKDLNIILAFKSLYNKYIDANHAPFMINISSTCREELMKLLDCNYYCNKIKQQKSNDNKIFDHQAKVSSDSTNKSFIDDQWLKHRKSIDWLLVKLLVQMDCAALEISILIRQSFLRFRKQTNI